MIHFFKRLFLALTLIVVSGSLYAQILEPVKWSHEVTKISGSEYELSFIAKIDKGWYVYSQEEADGFGPLPTTFEFVNNKGNYELIGSTIEPVVAPKYDKVFELDIKKFETKVVFKQKILLDSNALKYVEVVLDYQTCNDEKCIPGDHTFKINLDGTAVEAEVIHIDERSKQLSEQLQLNITGWDNYKKTTIEAKSNFSIFILT